MRLAASATKAWRAVYQPGVIEGRAGAVGGAATNFGRSPGRDPTAQPCEILPHDVGAMLVRAARYGAAQYGGASTRVYAHPRGSWGYRWG